MLKQFLKFNDVFVAIVGLALVSVWAVQALIFDTDATIALLHKIGAVLLASSLGIYIKLK